MSHQYPKVSVLLPTYNQKLYIRETLDSIIIQDYPNIEVVIGDDGSTDGTQEILKEYRDKYPRMFKLILSDRNYGVTRNCNKILSKCNGKYLALFAGDDLWLSGKIVKQVEFLEKKPEVVLCYTKVGVFDDKTGETLFIAPQKQPDKFRKDDVLNITMHLGCCGSSFMIRSSAVPENGFEKDLPVVSDWLFWIDVLCNGEIGCLDEVLARYRRHTNNLSSDIELIFAEHMLSLYHIQKKHPELATDAQKMKVNLFINNLAYHIHNQKKLEIDIFTQLIEFIMNQPSFAKIFFYKLVRYDVLKTLLIYFYRDLKRHIFTLIKK